MKLAEYVSKDIVIKVHKEDKSFKWIKPFVDEGGLEKEVF